MTDYRQKNKIVIPAKAGIQKMGKLLNSGFHRNDALSIFNYKENMNI